MINDSSVFIYSSITSLSAVPFRSVFYSVPKWPTFTKHFECSFWAQ